MSKKEKFPLYLSPEKKTILERRYQEDGSRSITAFIERAVDFYLDYLSANNAGLFLPTSIKSYLDGDVYKRQELMYQPDLTVLRVSNCMVVPKEKCIQCMEEHTGGAI